MGCADVGVLASYSASSSGSSGTPRRLSCFGAAGLCVGLPQSKDSQLSFRARASEGLTPTHPVKAVNDSVCGTRDEESEGLGVLNWSLKQFDRYLEVG